jgi:ABC-type phosphate transport system substrate-binding protein
LGRVTRWSDGRPIRAVDLSFTSPLRVAFCENVLGQELDALKAYWARAVSMGGATPPPVKASEQEVVEFVSRTAGAIGYVSPDVPLAEGVKVLRFER